jgi:RimJ/RimL family protein N-acetyltransferase
MSSKPVHVFTSKKGNEVTVRYPAWEDLDDLLKFANDHSREDTFVQLARERITRRQEQKYLRETLKAVEQGKRIHLVAFVNGRFAANTGITVRDRRSSHVGDLHISVAAQFREEGIGTELLKALIAEARQKGLRLIVLSCVEGNDRALHVYEKVGFTKAGVVPGAILYRGEHRGEILMHLSLQ